MRQATKRVNKLVKEGAWNNIMNVLSDWLASRKLIFCHHLKMKRWFLVSSRLHCGTHITTSHISVVWEWSFTFYRLVTEDIEADRSISYVRKSRLGCYLLSSKGISLGYRAWINNFLPFTFCLTDLALKNQDISRANTKVKENHKLHIFKAYVCVRFLK